MTRSTTKQTATPFIGGNYFDKYRSKNPIHRMLMRGFLSSTRDLLSKIEYKTVLEVGCGPGDLAAAIVLPNVTYFGIDIDSKEVEIARVRYPNLSFAVGSAYELTVETKSKEYSKEAVNPKKKFASPAVALSQAKFGILSWP